MERLYILAGREPVEVSSLDDWYEWFAAAGTRRIVGRAQVGPAVVFTAFQGLHRPPHPTGELYVFETIVLNAPRELGALNLMRVRYASWRDAELGHRDTVKRVTMQLAGAVLTPRQPAEGPRSRALSAGSP